MAITNYDIDNEQRSVMPKEIFGERARDQTEIQAHPDGHTHTQRNSD
jgi:hypothetical protein